MNGIVYNRLPLRLFHGDPVKLKLGQFVADLGKFEQSGKFGEVEFYLFPALNPREEPGSARHCRLQALRDFWPPEKAAGRHGRETSGRRHG